MKRILFVVLPAVAIALLMGFVWFDSEQEPKMTQTEVREPTDYKDIELTIDGQRVMLEDGYAEQEIVPGSAAKIITRYFSNEYRTDLNADGKEDVAFIVTQESGGSGTFYYAVAAVATDNGYAGTDGYLLGDRIAPQATTGSENPRHKAVVVFNYADRHEGEPMSAGPSEGKSAYLKLDAEDMRWAVVEADFSGEADFTEQ
jgi:hypothetical protein